MNEDKIFIDTNVLTYAYSVDEPNKMGKAIEILDSGNVTISIQVLREFFNVRFKKFKSSSDKIIKEIDKLLPMCELIEEHLEVLKLAAKLKEKYKYSFYDSLIISSALTSKCKYLYSEDMQDGQTIEGKLKIINPFVDTT